jgi:two-component system sensor histidine kinase UhpB
MGSRFIRIICLVAPLGAAILANAQPVPIDSLQKIVARRPGDTTEINALEKLISEFTRKDQALTKSYTWRQRSLSSKLQNHKGLTNAYATLVIIHLNGGRTDSSQYYLSEFEAFAKSSGNEKALMEYTNSAGLFYRNIGQPRKALPFLLEALRMLGTDGDKTRRAGQMLNVANAYQSMGDFENCSRYYRQSLALFEEVGNKRGQAYCLQGLGNTYKDLQRYDLAQKYHLDAEKLKEELGDKRGLLSSWMSLGALYQDMNQYDRSLQYALKGLASAREQKIYNEEMKFLYNMGSLMKSLKNPDDSRKYYNESMKMAQEFGDSVLISRIKTDLIMLESDTRKIIDDEQSMIRHVELAIENGDRAVTAEGRKKLADWYTHHGRYDKAYEQITIAHDLMDSIQGADVQVQIKKMEEEYLGEKKDREIALLKKDQELQTVELSRQNTMVTAVLIALFSVVVISLLLVNRYRVVNNAKRALEIERVRNSIARDLHDEMGSALSSINILSKVAMVEDAPLVKQYLQNIGDQSEKMMENMGDMVWSINPRNDSIEKIIARMREFATEILDAKDIDYLFTDELPPNLAIGSDKRKNLFMIFKEAVNNAAKYSHATRMEIGLAEDKGSLVLTVRDNGNGFEEEASRAGNGLRNMRERAGESGGSLSIRTAPGKGTEIQLRMSIA